jgi:hypothetical protein
MIQREDGARQGNWSRPAAVCGGLLVDRAAWQKVAVETLLLWVIRLVVLATLLPAFFITWYLAGSDDTPRNVVAPFIGLGVLVTAGWSAVIAFRALPEDAVQALWIFALGPALYLVGWPFAGNESMGRPRLLEYVPSAVWLSGPMFFGALLVIA